MARIATAIDYEKDLTVHTVEGAVAVEEILEETVAYYRGRSTSRILWDLSNAEVGNIPTEKVEWLVKQEKKFAELQGIGRIALLFADPFSFGMGRMYEIMTENENFPIEVRSFKDKALCFRWLGVSID